MHVIQKEGAGAVARRSPNGVVDVSVSLLHRALERHSFREADGNGGRERAASAMSGPPSEAWALEEPLESVGRAEKIEDGIAVQVSAFDEHRFGTDEQQAIGGVLHAFERPHLNAGEQRGFGRIGREKRGQGQEMLHERDATFASRSGVP